MTIMTASKNDHAGITPGGAPGIAPQTEAGKTLLLACGALAREIQEVIKANNWSHMQLLCLPAILHVNPEKIPAAVEAAVLKHKSNFERIYIVYADCGTGGELKRLCDDLGVEMIPGPHCYSFYEGNDIFAARSDDEITAFYLTDFLVRQFDAFVMRPLGLDRHPELRDAYFGHYEKLVYQAQTNDPALDAKAEDCARQLGLAYERRFTGYGGLGSALENWASTEC